MLENEIALVTGASRGIGRAIATRLGEQGATVIGTATSEMGATAITRHFAENAINGRGMVLNVTDREAVDGLLKEIESQYGSPTILVNNAGITRDNLLMRMKEEEDSIIQTNLTSLYRLSKGCLRAMMKARKGRIVNIASVVGSTGNPGQCNYSAAKAGMVGFTKSLARKWVPGDYGKFRRARFYRYRYDTRADRRTTQDSTGGDPAWPPWSGR